MIGKAVDWLLFGAGWCSGFTVAWSIWFFAPYLAARRRDRELAHRYRHRRPHPNGGTWPYFLNDLCECDAYENAPHIIPPESGSQVHQYDGDGEGS